METTFHFDPGCPWTWRTSRWLLLVAPQRGLALRWRAFSLAIVNEGSADGGGVTEQLRERSAASSRALRLVEALAAQGRHDDTLRFYTALGERVHDRDEALTDAAVDAAADAAGLDDTRAALDDPSWDKAVREAHDTAYGSAGPDVGSPVLLVEGATRGVHGPILGAVPEPPEAAELWDGLRPLLRSEVFFEVKRGRP
jgi:predicted DsbA family dithiol-disulfide isomerase